MFLTQFGLLIFICAINAQLTHCVCKKSFIVTCDSLPDVQYNPNKRSWNELLIEQDKYENHKPKYTLTYQQLNRDLSELKWLIVSGQLIKIESHAFTYCKNLQQLILYGNDVELIKRSTFFGFRNMMKLGLENNQIEQMQPSAFSQSYIEVVDLSHNKLQLLTTGVFRKCTVSKLSLTHNRLWKIDENSLPTSLKYLHLDYNRFDSLPEELKNLHQLQELTVSHNNLYTVPELGQMQFLTRMDLSFNKIGSIFQEFDNLTNLNYLDLSSNYIEKLSFSSQFIQNIKDHFLLLLAHNRLRNLDLHSIKHVRIRLSLSGNPWSCKCMDKLLVVLKNSNISTTRCDQEIFGSGQHPYCIVDDTNECSEDSVSASSLEKFKSAFENSTCDVFADNRYDY